MPDHKLGAAFSFGDLMRAYNADTQTDADAHYLLSRGDEILALCLRYKYNRDPAEVCIGNDKAVAEWGKKLADLKGRKTLPLYYSGRNRSLYEFKGEHLIVGDTEDPAELCKRKSPVPLSRIVFLKPVTMPSFAPPRSAPRLR